MSDGATAYEPADTTPRPFTPEGQAWVESVHADAADGTLWDSPSIREQLSEHYRRIGLSE